MLNVGVHKQTILKGKDWTSTSPNSELIVVVKVNVPAPGLKNTFVNVIDEVFPEVTLFPSGGDCAKILTPGLVLEIVKVPNDKPVTISYDCIIACCGLTIELTTRTVEKLLEPAFALMTAEPIVSPIDIKEIAKEPPSEANNEVDISGSLGS